MTMTESRVSICALLALMGGAACGGEDATCFVDGQLVSCEAGSAAEQAWAPHSPGSAPLQQRLAQMERDLGPGARGADVRALHEYLTQFGYLPNDELLESHSNWRPIVAQAPSDPELYDEHTQAAVDAMQRLGHLEATGIVDEPTRTWLRTPRCGFPDGVLDAADPSEKWAPSGQAFFDSGFNLTWTLKTTNFPLPNGVTHAQARAQIAAAFLTWSGGGALNFQELSAGGQIPIEFLNPAQQDPPMGSADADARQPQDGVRIRVNNIYTWSVDGTPSGGERDLQTVILHEAGHTLGLKHSSIGNTNALAEASDAVMNTQVGLKRALHVDDRVGVSAIYRGWFAAGGPARDVGVGADGADADTGPDAWIVGTTAVAGNGFQIKKWLGPSGSTYSAHATGGQGAVRIAVGPTGRPWIINGSGQVFERSNTDASTGTWQERGPACATDIGVNGTGSGTAWSLGCSADVNGNYRVYRWNGVAWVEPNGTARGKRISVDASGVPWLVTAGGSIWRRPAALGDWEQLPGLGLDIGAGPTASASVGGVVTPISYVYVTGPDQRIWAWNEQPANLPFNAVPGRYTWVSRTGTGAQVAMGPDGVPWIVRTEGPVFR